MMLNVFLLFFVLFGFSIHSEEINQDLDKKNLEINISEKKEVVSENKNETISEKAVEIKNENQSLNENTKVNIEAINVNEPKEEIKQETKEEKQVPVKNVVVAKEIQKEVKVKEEKQIPVEDVAIVNVDNKEIVQKVEEKKISKINLEQNQKPQTLQIENKSNKLKNNTKEEQVATKAVVVNLDNKNKRVLKEEDFKKTESKITENVNNQNSIDKINSEDKAQNTDVQNSDLSSDEVYFGAGVLGFMGKSMINTGGHEGSHINVIHRQFAPSFFTGARHNFASGFVLGIEYDINLMNIKNETEFSSVKLSRIMNLSIIFGYNFFNKRFTPFISFGPSMASYQASVAGGFYNNNWWSYHQGGQSKGLAFGAKAGFGFDFKIYRNFSMRIEYFLNVFWNKFNIDSQTIHFKSYTHNVRVGIAYRFAI